MNFSLMDHHKTANGKYISETEHDYTTRFLLVNGKKFDNLTDEQRGWIMQAVQEATAEERRLTYDGLEKSKEKVIADGAIVNTPDKAPFIALALPIQDALAERLGLQDTLAKIREEAK